MPYVLIVISYIYQNGPIVTMQEFTSKETCEIASKELANQSGRDFVSYGKTKGFCVQK